MSTLYIKYTNDNWSTETKVTILAILDREISNTKKEDGLTLRGFDFSHTLFNKTKRLIKIGADWLAISANKTSIRAIWGARALKYSDDDITYIDIKLESDGDYSPEYLEDDETLEETELKLIYKSPN